MAGSSYGRLRKAKGPLESPFSHHYPSHMRLSTWIILGVAIVAFLLYKRGITRVRPLLGGMDAWRERNYPLEPHLPT